jgi:hypothetical protein
MSAFPRPVRQPVGEVARVAIRSEGPLRNEVGGVDLLSVLALSRAEARVIGSTELIARLVERGISRLTAERVAEVELGAAEIGRARTHSQSRSQSRR